MLFKNFFLTGVVAAVAASPHNGDVKLIQMSKDQHLRALTGMPAVSSALGRIHIGPQTTYICGQDKIKYVNRQAVGCLLYFLDANDDGRLFYVMGNPAGLYGKVSSGDNPWDLTDENQYYVKDLMWFNDEPMDVNDANTFDFSFGADDTCNGFQPFIHVENMSFLDSVVTEDYDGERLSFFFMEPVQFDETYMLSCIYTIVTSCD
eukprot:Clim_evm9s100 gene=Clim_evmTU9s100